ncbi:MAG: hypothetical protein WCP28_03840 [Actinomycetes bacterium]
MSEFPGIVFKDGPSGRRAALTYGPDVWEVVRFLKEVDERGEGAVEAASEVLALPVARIRLAMQYYAEFPDEIDARIADADAATVRAEAEFDAQQRLLA